MDSLGIEIAKNIVLSGVKKLIVYDKDIITLENLLGNCFVTEQDIGLQKDITIVNWL